MSEKDHLLASENIHKKRNLSKCGLLSIQLSFSTYFMMYALFTVVSPQYVYDRMARKSLLYKNMTKSHNNQSECLINKSDPIYLAKQAAQEQSAQWQLYFNIADHVISWLVCLLLGSNSDRLGRKYLFILPTIGLLCQLCVYVFNSRFILPVWSLLIGHILNGLTGTVYAVVLGSMLCAADLTEVNTTRSVYITLINSTLSMAFAVIGFVSGYAITYLGFWKTFLINALLLGSVFIFVKLSPETHPSRSESVALTKFIKSIGKLYFAKSRLRKIYLTCLVTFSTTMLPLISYVGIDTLYYINVPFCWTSVKIGLFSGIRNVIQPVVAIPFVALLKLFLSDSLIGVLSVVLSSAGWLTMSFAYRDFHLYIAAALLFPNDIIKAMIRTVISKVTPRHQQGVALSGVTAVEVVMVLFGGSLFNAIYVATLSWFRGFVFLVLACILGVSGIGFIVLHIMIQRLKKIDNL